jgi:hypothetical protein
MYRQLDAAQIHETLKRLRDRITGRFPDSGLSKVSEEMLALSSEVATCAGYLGKPNWPVRLGSAISIALMIGILIIIVRQVPLGAHFEGLPDVFQALEAAINTILLFGAAVLFLLTVEARLKRRRALRLLEQLRSLAHVVDMHQLTKDPERLLADHQPTDPPRRVTTGVDLARYLDYCSELLSVISKLAALLVQNFDDGTVLTGVNEIEDLTTGLSGKIWQKISLLSRPQTGGL